MSEQHNIDSSYLSTEDTSGTPTQYTIEGMKNLLNDTLSGHQWVLLQEHMSHIIFKVMLLLGIQ